MSPKDQKPKNHGVPDGDAAFQNAVAGPMTQAEVIDLLREALWVRRVEAEALHGEDRQAVVNALATQYLSEILGEANSAIQSKLQAQAAQRAVLGVLDKEGMRPIHDTVKAATDRVMSFNVTLEALLFVLFEEIINPTTDESDAGQVEADLMVPSGSDDRE